MEEVGKRQKWIIRKVWLKTDQRERRDRRFCSRFGVTPLVLPILPAMYLCIYLTLSLSLFLFCFVQLLVFLFHHTLTLRHYSTFPFANKLSFYSLLTKCNFTVHDLQPATPVPDSDFQFLFFWFSLFLSFVACSSFAQPFCSLPIFCPFARTLWSVLLDFIFYLLFCSLIFPLSDWAFWIFFFFSFSGGWFCLVCSPLHQCFVVVVFVCGFLMQCSVLIYFLWINHARFFKWDFVDF